MVDLKKIQKEIYQNKINKGFNTTDVNLEFCLAYEELAEAFQAYHRKKNDLGEELADVAIYLLSIAEILGVDFEQELLKKIEKNKKREYIKIEGVFTRIKEAE